LRRHFEHCERGAAGGKIWMPSGTNYKRERVISSTPFSFHSYTFWLVSSVAVKSLISHLYTLYLKDPLRLQVFKTLH